MFGLSGSECLPPKIQLIKSLGILDSPYQFADVLYMDYKLG